MSPPEAEITELPSSPGARLRREREARGLSEQQAAESLNLDPIVITALEANDYAALGAPVFAKGHLRRYAAFLELDEHEILGAYERSKLQIGEPTLVPRSRLEMAPVRGRPRWPWVVGGTTVFLLAAALLAYVSNQGLPWSDTTNDVATDEIASSPAAETSPSFAGPTASVTETPPVPTSTDTAGTTLDQVPVVVGTPPTGAASAAAPPSGAAAPGASAAVPTLAPAPGQVSLQLRFSGDAWVEIFDGSGKAVVYDLGKSGTERTVTATAPLSVTIGNAPAVAIAINGRAVPPPPAPGAVARFSVGADGTLR